MRVEEERRDHPPNASENRYDLDPGGQSHREMMRNYEYLEEL